MSSNVHEPLLFAILRGVIIVNINGPQTYMFNDHLIIKLMKMHINVCRNPKRANCKIGRKHIQMYSTVRFIYVVLLLRMLHGMFFQFPETASQTKGHHPRDYPCQGMYLILHFK